MSEKTYQDGLVEGKLNALGGRVEKAESRLDHHSRRLGILEKIAWIAIGGVVLIQYADIFRDFLTRTP